MSQNLLNTNEQEEKSTVEKVMERFDCDMEDATKYVELIKYIYKLGCKYQDKLNISSAN